MDIPILYEDLDIVVIDKPSGIVVNRAETVKEETIQDWMDDRYNLSAGRAAIQDLGSTNEDEHYFIERSGIVHRLDRETSGTMVVAKTVDAFVGLLKEFKDRRVSKEYLALTHGIWKDKFGEISATVGRMRHNRKMFGIREDGRESVTAYRVEREMTQWEFPHDLKIDDRGYTGFSIVRFLPKTGRTHQIRVHARHLGHPLVGDFVYAGRKRSREDRKWSHRIMLHAKRLSFEHPLTHQNISFESNTDIFAPIAPYFMLA
jgi:23S rRNA pseudouridine1911/1915/1917 synthase